MSEVKSDGVWNKLGYVQKTDEEYVLGTYENGRVRTEVLSREEVEEGGKYKVEGTYIWKRRRDICANCKNKMLADHSQKFYCPVCE